MGDEPQGRTATPAPTAADFSGGAVQRAVLKETVQHPLTILPAAVAVVSGLYMGLISLDMAAFSVGFGAALLSAGAFVVNYFFRGESFAAAHIAALRAQRELQKREAAAELRSECAAAGFAAGAHATDDLTGAYEALRGFLAARGEAGSANAARFLVLAEETYQQGLRILRAALETQQALKEIDDRPLRDELQQWTRDLAALKKAAPTDARAQSRADILSQKIAAHQRRLALYDRHAEAVEKLLAESEGLEAALQSAYLEAMDLSHDSAPLPQNQAATRLEDAISAAKRVEARLQAARDTSKEDELYLTHGAAPPPRS